MRRAERRRARMSFRVRFHWTTHHKVAAGEQAAFGVVITAPPAAATAGSASALSERWPV